MNKLTELLVSKIGFKTELYDKKSKGVLTTFTDAIEDIDKVNEGIDKEVVEATEVITKVESHKDKLISTKEQNLRIKEKIQNIIS